MSVAWPLTLKTLVLFIIASLTFSEGRTQEIFESRISLPGNSAIKSTFESKDGSIYTCLYSHKGDTIEPMVAKLDKFGRIEWTRSHVPGSSIEKTIDATITEGFDSEVVFAECVALNSLSHVIRLTAYDRDGKRVWSNVIRRPSVVYSFQIQRDDLDSAFVIVSIFEDEGKKLSIIKINRQGNILWSRWYQYGFPPHTLSSATTVMVFDTGYCIGINASSWPFGITTMTYSRDGELIGHGPFIGVDEYLLHSMVRLDKENIAILGHAAYYQSSCLTYQGSYSYWKWTKMISSESSILRPVSCTPSTNGDIIVLCNTLRETESMLDSLVLLRISPKGQFLSGSIMAIESSGQNGYSISPTSDGGFLISGVITDSLYTETDGLVLKVDSNLSGCNSEPFSATLSDVEVSDYGAGNGLISTDTSVKNIDEVLYDISFATYTVMDLCNSVSVHYTPSQSSEVQVRPNPTSEKFLFHYTLRSLSPVSVTLHDILGREVLRREMGVQSEGEHEESFDVSELPVGSYIVKILTNGEVFTLRISVVR